jgi:hypothetical protein
MLAVHVTRLCRLCAGHANATGEMTSQKAQTQFYMGAIAHNKKTTAFDAVFTKCSK